MRSDSFRRLAAAAGLASASAVAGAQIPGEVTVPLGGSYGANCPTGAYGDVSGVGAYGTTGVVYSGHGGVFTAAANNGYPPARNPVERIPVQYLRYYPAVWYGLPGSTLPVVAPQVYMPTDTTQLGFYYQRVPTWVPVPGMIPGPPNPAMLQSYGSGVMGAALDGTTPVSTMGGASGETVTSERVISVRPLTTNGSNPPGHTASGQTATPPDVVPTPPAPAGSRLPLQPPAAPPAGEPSAFVPPPAPAPLIPVSTDDAI
jgi:hypothetical protein